MRRTLLAGAAVALCAAAAGPTPAGPALFLPTWRAEFRDLGDALIAEGRSRREFLSPWERRERQVLLGTGHRIRSYEDYVDFRQPHLLRAGDRLRRFDDLLRIHLPLDPAVLAIRDRLSLAVLDLQETAVQLARCSLQGLAEDGEAAVAAAVEARLPGIEEILDAVPSETDVRARYSLLRRSGRRLRLLWDVDLGDAAAVEARVVASLRAIRAAEQSFRAGGFVDADGDGAGEYGTLAELAGRTGVRAGVVPGVIPGSDFSARGLPLEAAFLPASFGDVDSGGFMIRHGYAFVLYLPSTGVPPGFIHEQGPPASASVHGPVGVDASESLWCAYAHPLVRGIGGTRAFFIHADGTILVTRNEVYRHEGNATAVMGNSAFLGYGFDSLLAVGTSGSDTNLWKPLPE